MIGVFPQTIKIQIGGYCSQFRKPIAHPKTIEEGVTLITDIVAKRLICTHDVNDLNRLFQDIDSLERDAEVISGFNSALAISRLVKKIQKIVDELDKGVNVDGLITLYHLRRFVGEDLRLMACFQRCNITAKSSHDEFLIAQKLPCCVSQELFDVDAKSLIGPAPCAAVEVSLEGKRKVLREHHIRLKAISDRKLDFQDKRRQYPSEYPTYLNALIDDGYLNLYDHLTAMRKLISPHEKRLAIESITFSRLSNIILETREAIISQVRNTIPKDCNKIWFLLGSAGAGKTTTMCFLRGDEMTLQGRKYVSNVEDSNIGHEIAKSATFLPFTAQLGNISVVDFPGLGDTHGILISLGIEFALKALIQEFRPSILFVEAITNTADRMQAVAEHGSTLRRFLKDTKGCLLGLTKYSEDVDYISFRVIENEQLATLSNPTTDELKIRGGLNVLEELLNATTEAKILDLYEVKIRNLRAQLVESSNNRKRLEREPLPDTQQKRRLKDCIQDKENALQQAIGIQSFIQFSDLSNPKTLFNCLKELSDHNKRVEINLQRKLDPSHYTFLDRIFCSQFVDIVKSIELNNFHSNFASFAEAVLTTSLLESICVHSKPEIGQLLHLPEIDPDIVRKYDQYVLEDCLSILIQFSLKQFKTDFFQRLIKEVKTRKDAPASASFTLFLARITKLTSMLVGENVSIEPQRFEEYWDKISARPRSLAVKIDDEINWVMEVLFVKPTTGKKFSLFNAANVLDAKTKTKLNYEVIINNWSEDLSAYILALENLSHLKTIAVIRRNIEITVFSYKTNLASFSELQGSLRAKLHEIKEAYSQEAWKKRVGIPDAEVLIHPGIRFCAAACLLDPSLESIWCNFSKAGAFHRSNKLFSYDDNCPTFAYREEREPLVNTDNEVKICMLYPANLRPLAWIKMVLIHLECQIFKEKTERKLSQEKKVLITLDQLSLLRQFVLKLVDAFKTNATSTSSECLGTHFEEAHALEDDELFRLDDKQKITYIYRLFDKLYEFLLQKSTQLAEKQSIAIKIWDDLNLRSLTSSIIHGFGNTLEGDTDGIVLVDPVECGLGVDFKLQTQVGRSLSAAALIKPTTSIEIQLRLLAPGARDLIYLCAYLNPALISIDYLKKWLSLQSYNDNLQEIIKQLENYAFLKLHSNQSSFFIDAETWIILRLLAPKEAAAKAVHLIAILRKEWNLHNAPDWKGNMDRAIMWASHAVSLLGTFEKNDLDLLDRENLLEGLGDWEGARGNKIKAIEYHQKVLEIRKTRSGNASLNIAESLNTLGWLYNDLDKVTESLQTQEDALGIRKAQLGENHVLVAESLTGIGRCYCNQKKYELAIQTCKTAIQILRSLEKEDCHQMALSLTTLASCYLGRKEYSLAFKNLNEALRIRKTIFGEQHPLVALSLFNIGLYYADQSQHHQAQQMYEEALQIQRAVLGDDHSVVAESILSIGNCSYNCKEYDTALQKYEEALHIWKAAFGDNDRTVAECLKFIGNCYLGQGQQNLALSVYKKAQQILPDDKEILQVVINISTQAVSSSSSNSSSSNVESAQLPQHKTTKQGCTIS